MVESIDLHLFILLCISLSFHHCSFILLEEVDWLEESAGMSQLFTTEQASLELV